MNGSKANLQPLEKPKSSDLASFPPFPTAAVGTLAYMSPQALLDEHDPRVDQFAFGVLLYEIFMNKPLEFMYQYASQLEEHGESDSLALSQKTGLGTVLGVPYLVSWLSRQTWSALHASRP